MVDMLHPPPLSLKKYLKLTITSKGVCHYVLILNYCSGKDET